MRLERLIGPWFAPLAWCYGLAVSLRNLLYDERILPSVEVRTPTICVGNLAVGGTGKTPHVEYLIDLLTAHGYRVAMLSRGYKRKTSGFVLAGENATAATIGDEAMLIHRKHPEVIVAVCKDRVKAIRILEAMPNPPQVIILDDAYQYRRLRCGYNILLTAHDYLYADDRMLPAGRLRDNRHQAGRANAIVVTKCSPTMTAIERRIVNTKLSLPLFQHLFFSHMVHGDVLLQGTPLVLAGIAHPELFLRQVQQTYPEAELMAYSDHHRFSRKDIAAIAERARGFAHVLTTEKDYVRLMLHDLPDDLRQKLVSQPYSMVIDDEEDQFNTDILRYVHEGLYQPADQIRTSV